MRKIIAFIGPAGCGKSTAAAALVSGGYIRHRFAGPLKAMLRALGLTREEVDGNLKETPSALLGCTPREAMQSLGTQWGREMIHGDLWMRAWINGLPTEGLIVVDDCRFPNEAEAVRRLDGTIVRVIRPGWKYESEHESEAHHESMEADHILAARNVADLQYMVRDLFGLPQTPDLAEGSGFTSLPGSRDFEGTPDEGLQPIRDFDGLGGGA